eukprot:9122535-Ditylum_brightwellii.AAC.1
MEGAGAVYWNRKYWVEFLDKRLCLPGNNVLQESLYIILLSSEMSALAQVCSIIHLAICFPMCWLAGNSHKQDKYSWLVHLMGWAADALENAMEVIQNDGA